MQKTFTLIQPCTVTFFNDESASINKSKHLTLVGCLLLLCNSLSTNSLLPFPDQERKSDHADEQCGENPECVVMVAGDVVDKCDDERDEAGHDIAASLHHGGPGIRVFGGFRRVKWEQQCYWEDPGERQAHENGVDPHECPVARR